MPLVEQELLTLPKHLSSPPGFSGVRVTLSLVLYVYFLDRCLSFCTFSFGHCVVCLFLYFRWRSNYQDCDVCMVPSISLTATHIYVHIPNKELNFHSRMPWSFRFQWLEVRGSCCSFNWYWLNCWPSLLKPSFQKHLLKIGSSGK